MGMVKEGGAGGIGKRGRTEKFPLVQPANLRRG